MNGQVSGLGTVQPILTMKFLSTWIHHLHVVFFPLLSCAQSPSAMELWMTGAGSGLSWRPLVHALHVGGLDWIVAE